MPKKQSKQKSITKKSVSIKKKSETEKEKEELKQAIEEFLLGTDVSQKLSEAQKKLFIRTAMSLNLNPLKREIHCIPYWNRQTGKYEMEIVVGYETYLKRAEASGMLNGWRCWVEGSIKDGTLKAIVEIYRKDWSYPFRHEVYYNEYYKETRIWKERPITMIKKVAISQAFRLAFPETVSGLPYTVEEVLSFRPQLQEPLTGVKEEPKPLEPEGDKIEVVDINPQDKKQNEKQIDLSNITPDSICNFGKYKDKPFKEIPSAYLIWLMNNRENPAEKQAIEKILHFKANTKFQKLCADYEIQPEQQQELLYEATGRKNFNDLSLQEKIDFLKEFKTFLGIK